MKTDEHARSRDHHVVGGDDCGALVLRQFGIGLQALGQRDAEAGLMRATFRRRNGVAIGMHDAVAAIPGDGPFERSRGRPVSSVLPAKISRVTVNSLPDRRLKIVLQAAGEVEHRLVRRLRAFDQRRDRSDQRISTPPNR